MSITIGPVHIADAYGTHKPGAVVDLPSEALIALADDDSARDAGTGLRYAVHTPEPVADPEVKPKPEPEPETLESATPAEEAA